MRSLSKFTPGDVLAALLYLSNVREMQGGIPDVERGIRAAYTLSPLLRKHFMAGRTVRVLPFDAAVGRLLLGELLDYRGGALIVQETGQQHSGAHLSLFTDSERAELREAAQIFAIAVA